MRHRARQAPRQSSTKSADHPFRGFFPFSVLPATKSHLTLVSLHLTSYVAPLEFLTPSTPCSLRDLLGLFHPSSARGVLPSRLCSPRNAVRPLRRRDPHAIACRCWKTTASSPQGFARSRDPALGRWDLAKRRARCPHGILPLRGFLLAMPDRHRQTHSNGPPSRPSHALPTRSHADLVAGVPRR